MIKVQIAIVWVGMWSIGQQKGVTGSETLKSKKCLGLGGTIHAYTYAQLLFFVP